MQNNRDSGIHLYHTSKHEDKKLSSKESSQDTIILLVVVWMLASRMFWNLIPKFFESFYTDEWFIPVNAFMSLVWAIIPLGLAFTIRNQAKQPIAFVLAALFLLYGLYETALIFL